MIEAGHIQATGPVSRIVQDLRPHREIYLRCLEDVAVVERRLAELPHIDGIRQEREGLVFDFQGNPAEQAELLADLVQEGLRPLEFAAKETNLEDVFLRLTEGKVQ